jgi:hypothetical protein
MPQPQSGRAITNESQCLFIVELFVDAGELSVDLNRRMMDFHRSRKIQVQHGRRIIRESQPYFRWCFRDLATAQAFIEQFGGTLYTSNRLTAQ